MEFILWSIAYLVLFLRIALVMGLVAVAVAIVYTIVTQRQHPPLS
jgi:hypothetical protein